MTSDLLQSAIDSFDAPRGYLAAASMGLPPRQAIAALAADLEAWRYGNRDPQDYDSVIAATRASYASLVGMPLDRVAQGSQTSVLASLIATAAPARAEILCVEGDFSSIIFPFCQRPDITVRSVPLSALADSVTDQTWLTVFSLVQSSNGIIADTSAIISAATAHGSFTLCDTTQAVGVLPVNAALFDATVCHSYKWLCTPRGVAFLTLAERFDALLTPVQAGWYAGDDVWQNCYGSSLSPAPSARRFDVSPAWHAWVGAEVSLALFAGLDLHEVWQRASGLGDALCDAVGIAQQHQAIVSWPDASGNDLKKLQAAGIRASGRAGRLRASFHLWNTEADVDMVLRALR
ncbi:MAG: aminotransferase class V-fold PLP-dependent enzyme [Rhodoglobus sp.]